MFRFTVLLALAATAMAVRTTPQQTVGIGAAINVMAESQPPFKFSREEPDDVLVNDEALISAINEKTSRWIAGKNDRFEGSKLKHVQNLCGTVLPHEEGYQGLPIHTGLLEPENIRADLPSHFRADHHWKGCQHLIGVARDQSDCGSCWAFGSTEAFNDRMCIVHNFTTMLSTEDTTACCGELSCASMGCNGGQPGLAWNWFSHTGVVTGGLYEDIGKSDTCEPYTLAPCEHHVPAQHYKPCGGSEFPTPKCTKKCQDSFTEETYHADKHEAAKAYGVPSSPDAIMTEIFTNGPVTGAFTVYSDFPTYKSGVYHKTAGATPLGGHAIKVIGWGSKPEPYWLVVNSWNQDWGDNGMFKIARGNNECGIESQISAGAV